MSLKLRFHIVYSRCFKCIFNYIHVSYYKIYLLPQYLETHRISKGKRAIETNQAGKEVWIAFYLTLHSASRRVVTTTVQPSIKNSQGGDAIIHGWDSPLDLMDGKSYPLPSQLCPTKRKEKKSSLINS